MNERSAREKMIAGEPYLADDPELVLAAQRARVLMEDYNSARDLVRPGILRELLGPPAATDLAPPPTGDPSAAGRTVK